MASAAARTPTGWRITVSPAPASPTTPRGVLVAFIPRCTSRATAPPDAPCLDGARDHPGAPGRDSLHRGGATNMPAIRAAPSTSSRLLGAAGEAMRRACRGTLPHLDGVLRAGLAA